MYRMLPFVLRVEKNKNIFFNKEICGGHKNNNYGWGRVDVEGNTSLHVFWIAFIFEHCEYISYFLKIN